MHIPNNPIAGCRRFIRKLITPQRLILTQVHTIPPHPHPIHYRYVPLPLILNILNSPSLLMEKLIGVDFSDNRDDVDEAEKEVEQETPDLGIIIKGYVLADEQSITECEHSDDDAQTD